MHMTTTPDTAEPRRRGRPPSAEGPKPTRSLRVGDEWDAAVKIAAERGESVNQLVSAYLKKYVARHQK